MNEKTNIVQIVWVSPFASGSYPKYEKGPRNLDDIRKRDSILDSVPEVRWAVVSGRDIEECSMNIAIP